MHTWPGPMGKLDIKEAKVAQLKAATRDYIVQPRLGKPLPVWRLIYPCLAKCEALV